MATGMATNTRGSFSALLSRIGLAHFEARFLSLEVNTEESLLALTCEDLITYVEIPLGLARVAYQKLHAGKPVVANQEAANRRATTWRLPKDLPEWPGRASSTSSSPMEHLVVLSILLTAAGVPEDAWPAALAVTLPTFAMWAKSNLIDSNPSWSEASKRFKERFGYKNHDSIKRAELVRCRQNGRPIAAYVADFERLHSEAGLADNDEFGLTLFVEGLDLQRQTLFKISVDGLSTISEYFRVALEKFSRSAAFEANSLRRNFHSASPVGSSKPRPRSHVKKCSYHGECGHTTSECNVLKNKSVAKGRFPAKSDPQPYHRQGNASRSNSSMVTCFKCGQTGHYANRCTQARQAPELNAIFSDEELQAMMQAPIQRPPRSEN